MKIHILGTASGHTSLERQHSALYLEDEDQSMLIDCGCHVAQLFHQKRIHPDHPHTLYISHAHSDHLGQFHSLIQDLWLRRRQKKLTIMAPKKLLAYLRNHLATNLLFPELLGFKISWKTITNRPLKMGNWQLHPFPTTHLNGFKKSFGKLYPDTCFECYGVHITSKDCSLCISTDLGSPNDLSAPLTNHRTHTLIVELAHYSPEELFEHLAQHSLERVIITHYGDEWTNQAPALRSMAKKLGCTFKIKLAKDLMPLHLGASGGGQS